MAAVVLTAVALWVGPAQGGTDRVAGAADARLRVLLFEHAGALETAGGPGSQRERIETAGDREIRVGGRPRPPGVVRSAAGPGQVVEIAAVGGEERWRVRGALEVQRTPRGLAAINVVPLEAYLVATVGAEMSPTWEIEALKAQAVVSRTYALHQQRARRGAPYDLRADTGSQRYRGVDDESARVREAVRATDCGVLTHDGAPILAAFHSASGGRTASAEEVWGRPLDYLVSREVPNEDASPDTYWRVELSGATLGRALDRAGEPVGDVERIAVRGRTASGRVARLAIEGDRGRSTLTGRALRQAVGETVLRSTLFQVGPAAGGGRRFVFAGTGYGHGVGMSQWGARSMAAEGAPYQEILAAFYPGARLESCRTSAAPGSIVRSDEDGAMRGRWMVTERGSR